MKKLHSQTNVVAISLTHLIKFPTHGTDLTHRVSTNISTSPRQDVFVFFCDGAHDWWFIHFTAILLFVCFFLEKKEFLKKG